MEGFPGFWRALQTSRGLFRRLEGFPDVWRAFQFLLGLVIPSAIVLAAYAILFRRLRLIRRRSLGRMRGVMTRPNRRMLHTVIVVVVAFVACQTPYYVLQWVAARRRLRLVANCGSVATNEVEPRTKIDTAARIPDQSRDRRPTQATVRPRTKVAAEKIPEQSFDAETEIDRNRRQLATSRPTTEAGAVSDSWPTVRICGYVRARCWSVVIVIALVVFRTSYTTCYSGWSLLSNVTWPHITSKVRVLDKARSTSCTCWSSLTCARRSSSSSRPVAIPSSTH